MMDGARPTYCNGFAPRDYLPAFPSLWNRCVGAWCPSLGATGASLHDWSGYGLDLAGTGVTLDTVWTINGGRLALDNISTSSNLWSATPRTPQRFTGEMTACAWIQPDLFTLQNRGVMSHWRNQTGNTNQRKWNMSVQLTTAKLTASISTAGTASSNSITGSTTLSAGTWYHVAFVYVPSTSLEVFVNGVSDGINTTSIVSSLFDSAAPIWLGLQTDSTNTQLYFDGRLDDARLYDRALAAWEIGILAQRRGISYEPLQLGRRFVPASAPASFKSAWAAGRNKILTPGIV